MMRDAKEVKINPIDNDKYQKGMICVDEGIFSNLAANRELRVFKDRSERIVFAEGPIPAGGGRAYDMVAIRQKAIKPNP